VTGDRWQVTRNQSGVQICCSVEPAARPNRHAVPTLQPYSAPASAMSRV
jgi:hypothetical protein